MVAGSVASTVGESRTRRVRGRRFGSRCWAFVVVCAVVSRALWGRVVVGGDGAASWWQLEVEVRGCRVVFGWWALRAWSGWAGIDGAAW